MTDDEITGEIQRQVAEVKPFQPGLYAWVAVMVSAVTLPIIALVVALHVNARAIDSERQAREASEKALCVAVVTQDDGYKQYPPQSDVIKNQVKALRELRAAYRCDER